jgi:hypothetical protein
MLQCKPKTIDHLMSLANEWADGEDSIANPGVVAAHQTATSIQRINSTPVHGECDKKDAKAVMEIRIQQTW